MKNKVFSLSKFTLVTASLLIGFLCGVVFTVYQSPSITSQLAGTGQSAIEQIDWAQHITHLKESLDKDPNNVKTLGQLANAYYEAQDFRNSIESYLTILGLVDKKSEVYQDLGIVYRRDGQFEKSIESFNKAIEENPENIQALFNIGVVQYHDLNDEAGAKKTWQKLADIKPDFQVSTGQTIQQLVEQLK